MACRDKRWELAADDDHVMTWSEFVAASVDRSLTDYDGYAKLARSTGNGVVLVELDHTFYPSAAMAWWGHPVFGHDAAPYPWVTHVVWYNR